MIQIIKALVNSPQEKKISVKQELEVAEQKVYTNLKHLSQREETNGATEEEGKKKDFLKLKRNKVLKHNKTNITKQFKYDYGYSRS